MGPTADGAQILRASQPAQSQFDREALTILCSSPDTQTGAFYENYRRACALAPGTTTALNPDTLVIHAPSWEMYDGWDTAHLQEMYPGGPNYVRFMRPILSANSADVEEARRNDDAAYRVEYAAEWRSVRDAFFPQAAVDNIFAPFRGVPLDMVLNGRMEHEYYLHIDPSSTVSNTAVTVAHIETHDELSHLVFDFIDYWRPSQFALGHVDYAQVQAAVLELIEAFRPVSVTMDTYPGHVLEAWLNKDLAARRRFARISVEHPGPYEKADRYDRLRTMALQGTVHAPPHPLARLELSSIQRNGHRIEAPTSGPCQTDDIADCMAWTAKVTIGADGDPRRKLGNLHVSAGPAAWQNNPYAELFSAAMRPRRTATRNPARPRPPEQRWRTGQGWT